MIDKRNHVAFARYARMADPAPGFIQYFARRILEAIASVEIADNGQLRTIWRPVGPLNVFQNLTRRSAAERHARQRAAIDLRLGLPAAQQDRHLSGGRNRQNFSARNSHRAGFRRTESRAENFYRTSLPSRAVDNRLAVGSEPRHANCAAAIGQQMIGGRYDNAGMMQQKKCDNGYRRKQRGSQGI